MKDYVPLDRTPDVCEKLASGAYIVEMDYRKSPMVERLVAVTDVKVPKKEREPDKHAEIIARLAQQGVAITIAKARELGLIPGDPYRDTRPIAPPHVEPAHIVRVSQDSPQLARAKRRQK